MSNDFLTCDSQLLFTKTTVHQRERKLIAEKELKWPIGRR